jgi:hypothetical protein
VREMTRIYGRDREGRQYVATVEVYAPKP